MSKKQRKVSDTLGKNITSEHEKIYSHIESVIGNIKKCNFGNKRGSKTGVKHEGDEYIHIRDFELKSCNINLSGKVVIDGGDGLQGFCRICSKKKREKRTLMSREKNKGGYDNYETEYGNNTKKCSICKQDKNIRDCFKLSSGMECGLHNACVPCTKKYGESMGDRAIKYRSDGSFKYKKTDKDQHDDHIMPLVYGGTNEEINHQLISSKENLKKSCSIPFYDIMDINPLLLSSRWRNILINAQEQKEKISITILKSRIADAMLEEQKNIYSMKDNDIEIIYKDYNKCNNRRLDIKRCVKKFKIYCKEILKL
jgi:hypothetical protein